MSPYEFVVHRKALTDLSVIVMVGMWRVRWWEQRDCNGEDVLQTRIDLDVVETKAMSFCTSRQVINTLNYFNNIFRMFMHHGPQAMGHKLWATSYGPQVMVHEYGS